MKCFLKTLLIFLIPFLFVLTSYFIFDPFKVLYKYDDYYEKTFVPLNRDFVSTSTLLNKYQRNRYDSYILGSSRTIAFKTTDWIYFIGNDAKPFVYDASDENIAGIESKLRLLDSLNSRIDNALIIICTDASFVEKTLTASHLIIKHPVISGQRKISFQYKFLATYFTRGFFIRFLDFEFFYQWRNYMSGFLQPGMIIADSVTNDMFAYKEQEIRKDSLLYYDKYMYEFQRQIADSAVVYQSKQIIPTHINLLNSIYFILKKHNTNYKIIISPLYDQKKINPDDLKILKSVFGDTSVFDFSGKNEITDNKYNYFERSHYRYRVGKLIMKEIYAVE